MPVVLPNQLLSSIARPVHEWIRANFLSTTEPQIEFVTFRPLWYNNFFSILFLVWLAGIAVYFIIRCLINIAFTNRLRKELKPASDVESSILKGQLLSDKSINKLGYPGRVELYLSDGVFSPIVYGFLHKKIVLPRVFAENYSPEDLFLVLRHEVVHIAHHDSWKRLFYFFVHAINWFNPTLFLMERNLDEALEIYCDHDTIIDKYDSVKRYQYSDLLLSMIENSRSRSTVGLSLSKKGTMSKRLDFTMQEPKKPEKLFVCLVSLLLCITVFVCFLWFTAPSSHAQSFVPSGVTDTGEPGPTIPKLLPDDSILTHFLSMQGDYLFELQMEQDVFYYAPVAFLTDTTDIRLELLTGNCSVQVYLYNSGYKDDYIMEFVLGQDSISKTFSGLSCEYTYLLRVSVDITLDMPVLFLVSD